MLRSDKPMNKTYPLCEKTIFKIFSLAHMSGIDISLVWKTINGFEKKNFNYSQGLKTGTKSSVVIDD